MLKWANAKLQHAPAPPPPTASLPLARANGSVHLQAGNASDARGAASTLPKQRQQRNEGKEQLAPGAPPPPPQQQQQQAWRIHGLSDPALAQGEVRRAGHRAQDIW